MRFFDGEEPATEAGASPAADAATTAAPAGGDVGGPVPPHDPGNDGFPEKQTEGGTNTTNFAPVVFDQSYSWMLQLVVLVAAMTMLFPFLRNIMGIKRTKRQVVNYSSYDSGEEDDDEDCEENCGGDLKEYCEED